VFLTLVQKFFQPFGATLDQHVHGIRLDPEANGQFRRRHLVEIIAVPTENLMREIFNSLVSEAFAADFSALASKCDLFCL
jgi:hypothetical protein